MYQVSNAFKTMMKKAQRVEHVRGTIGSASFTDDNLISLSYSNRCSDTKDVTFGSAYIGQIQAIFRGLNIARGYWRGLTITLEYGMELDNEHTTEWVPCGVFYITQAEWTDTGINITACDVLSLLDKPFVMSTTTGTVYDLLKLVERDTGVICGMTQEECEALPNGDQLLGLYVQNDITTYRDFVSWIAYTVGGFAVASRDGKLLVKSFADSALVDTFVSRNRIIGSVFSDYSTEYAGISIQDADVGATLYYSPPGATGSYISLGFNPLLQYGTTAIKETQRMAVATVAASIQYTPFSISLLNCPVYDLGDLIKCSGGVAGVTDLTCCVMSIEWSLKNTINLQGFGADPNLIAGKSKTDKALNGLRSQARENETVIHIYENSRQFNLGDGEEEAVVSIEFATVKPTRVLTFTEVNFDLTITDPTGIASATAYYYLNGQLQGYQPVGTWNNDGKHILSLMYPLLSAGSTAYEWKVALEVDGGTATIDRGDVHAVLEGQGLVALDQFDGLLTLTDTYTAVDADKDFMEWLENVNVSQTSWNDITLSEVFTDLATDKDFATWSESVAIDFFLGPWEPMITEDDYDLLTEDGDQFYTEGEIV